MRALLVQPKRLALFTYLLLANPPRFHRRDSLVALFWPESPDEDARRALRQALHFLRTSVGADIVVNRGDEEVGIDFSAVWCDVREFERALDSGRPDEALRLYRGDLLEGFHASGVAVELGQWLEDERSRLRARSVQAAWSLAEQAERDGNPSLGVRLLRDVLRLDPAAEKALRKLMVLLDSTGDRAGALRAYDEFVRHLAAHNETAPSRETQRLADRMRERREMVDLVTDSRSPAAETATAPPGVVAESAVSAAPGPSVTVGPTRHRARWLAFGVTALVAGIATVAVVRAARSARDAGATTMVLAVGAVEDRTGVDSLGSARVLRDLLATDLARLSGVTVVSQTRMQELVARLAPEGETRAALTRAAQSAGAAEVLEGDLYRRSPRELRLDLRRVNVATGVIRRAYTAEGADVFALVERLSGQLAAELGQKAPSPSLADLTTTSLVARRFYEEGVRAWYQGDGSGALRLFAAALAEDSTFAMAAYFASRADPSLRFRYGAQAVRMSSRATDRERLLIATNWAEITSGASLVALAESLARRFPLEPEADFALGRALLYSGDFERAVTSFTRAADRDSLSLPDTAVGGGGRLPPCTACEALIYLVNAYAQMDSTGAAERVARKWVRRQPRSRRAWTHLARTLELQGRFDDALNAWRTRQTLLPGELLDDVVYRATVAIRAGNFAEADGLLAERVRGGGPPLGNEALWWQVVSFRNQGRLGAALAAALRWRAGVGDSDISAPLLEAQVLFEMGRAREAGRLFETIASRYRPPVPAGTRDSALGDQARHLTWYLTHTATSYAAAGDTARLARLADSVQAVGALSAYGRDRRLHHHLRGLLFLARGQREEAVESFRRAIHSTTFGYTRTNLELGRVLMALGRPRDAAAVLAPALRGDLQASNLYVTHAELHEALAQAYDAAGAADSARRHYAWVANAWRLADPPFGARAAQARVKAGLTKTALNSLSTR